MEVQNKNNGEKTTNRKYGSRRTIKAIQKRLSDEKLFLSLLPKNEKEYVKRYGGKDKKRLNNYIKMLETESKARTGYGSSKGMKPSVSPLNLNVLSGYRARHSKV